MFKQRMARMLSNPRGKLFLTGVLFCVGFAAAVLINQHAVGPFSFKRIIGYVTVALSVSSLGHFILDALWGKSKPHLYSWLIWTVVNGIAWFNQWTHQAGPGAWSTLVMTILSGAIFCIALYQYFSKTSDHHLTILDQWCLGGAAISIVFLVIFKTGPISIFAATVTDVFAFGPTIKKVWRHPHSEPLSNYSLNTLRHTIALSAMDSYNFVTLLFPISLIFFNGITVIAIVLGQQRTSTDSSRTRISAANQSE
jgi:hypothetical protein